MGEGNKYQQIALCFLRVINVRNLDRTFHGGEDGGEDETQPIGVILVILKNVKMERIRETVETAA